MKKPPGIKKCVYFADTGSSWHKSHGRNIKKTHTDNKHMFAFKGAPIGEEPARRTARSIPSDDELSNAPKGNAIGAMGSKNHPGF